jgi:hypothetical protein
MLATGAKSVMASQHQRIRTGTWLDDDGVRCRVELWRCEVRPGTGGPDDEPEWREDQAGEWYQVVWTSPGSSAAGAGYYPDLREALDVVASTTRNRVRWYSP